MMRLLGVRPIDIISTTIMTTTLNVLVWLFPEKGKESFHPPGTPLFRTDFLRKGFLRDCRGRGYQPLQRVEPAQTRF